MAKNERLGNVPSGLDWLSQDEENVVPAKAEPIKHEAKPSRTELPKKQKAPLVSTTSERGLGEGWTRATFIVKKENLEKLKDFAYWERTTVKQALDLALGEFFKGKKVRRKKA